MSYKCISYRYSPFTFFAFFYEMMINLNLFAGTHIFFIHTENTSISLMSRVGVLVLSTVKSKKSQSVFSKISLL